jgi:hypothetical protein
MNNHAALARAVDSLTYKLHPLLHGNVRGVGRGLALVAFQPHEILIAHLFRAVDGVLRIVQLRLLHELPCSYKAHGGYFVG